MMGLENFKGAAKIIETDSLINASATGATVFLGEFALAGIVVPASMAGTSISFEVSLNGTDFFTLKDDLGNTVSVTLTSGSTAGFYSLRRILPMAVPYIRPVSQASETSKTVTLVGQRVV